METIVDFTKPRNVVEQYKWMSSEDILKDLATKRHNYSILLCNLKNDVNIGSAVRSHAGFLGGDIILYGHKTFNRAPALGTYAYSIIKHLKVSGTTNSTTTKRPCSASGTSMTVCPTP